MDFVVEGPIPVEELGNPLFCIPYSIEYCTYVVGGNDVLLPTDSHIFLLSSIWFFVLTWELILHEALYPWRILIL